LIGKRYQGEKKDNGGDRKSVPHNEEVKPTAQRIVEQNKVSHATVERAEKFANVVDKVAENVGINPQRILSTHYQIFHHFFLLLELQLP